MMSKRPPFPCAAFVYIGIYLYTLFLLNLPSLFTACRRVLSCQHIGEVEEQLRTSKEEMEQCLSEYDELFRTIQRLSEELNTQIAANAAVQASKQASTPIR